MNITPEDLAAVAQGAKNAAVDTVRQLQMSGVSVKDIQVEVETLTEFKKKVDAMLLDLDSSDASESSLGQQTIDQGHVGTGFEDATNLLNAYHVVHQNLQTLSQTLSDQIQAMSITINIGASGYQGVDDTQRQQLWKIHEQTDSQYKAGVKPDQIVKPLDQQPATPPTTADSNGPTPGSNTSSTSSSGVG